MSKKKVGIIIGVVVLVAAATVGGLYFSGKIGNKAGGSEDKVFVQTVSTVISQYGGDNNRYSGVVEPQGSWDVNKDGDRTVKEVFVKEGDEVKEGDQLFSYDTEELALQLEQQKLELENIANEIAGYNTQIAELQAEKAAAPADQQFEYTTQIQTAQASIKQSEYNRKSKQAEIDKTQKSIDNSVVTSKIAGVVKSINESGTDDNGNSAAYMTILATGEYQVKGMVNETNMSMINAGQPVIIRSRVDETLTWKGTISKIDTENTVTSNSDSYSDSSSDDTTTTTKYPFYVALDSMDGLILGQHVYIELDMGQGEKKDGIWLTSSYIIQKDGDPYVWVANDREKLEKRTVELGEYDENLDEYEIKSGLTEEDYIAWPIDGMEEGMKTVTNAEDVDYSSPLYNQDGTEIIDEGTGNSEMMYNNGMGDTEMMYDDGMGNTEQMNVDPAAGMSEEDEKKMLEQQVEQEAGSSSNAEVAE